jgi:hypothetical protein
MEVTPSFGSDGALVQQKKRVIPRLAKHAEGPLKRSIAFAKAVTPSVRAAFVIACVTQIATARSLGALTPASG